MMQALKQRRNEGAITVLTLLTSTGTLVCCALPITLVTLGLGSAVVGGLILSTLFTLILIPLLLVTFLEGRSWLFTRFGRNPLGEAARRRQLAQPLER